MRRRKLVLADVCCALPRTPSGERVAWRQASGPLLMSEPNEAECAEEKRLLAEMTHALGSLVEIQSSQMATLALGDRKVSLFEEEIRVVLSAWQHARHAYIQHVLDHGCLASKDK